MTSRARPMAIDAGTSSDAAESLDRSDRERVAAAITVILSEFGALTDEQIVDRYTARAGANPSVPRVTPQRIRTARSELVHVGQVRDANLLAFSKLGNRATAWTLA